MRASTEYNDLKVMLMIQWNPAFYEESDKSKFSIDIMESDKDHIHLLITYSKDRSLTFINQKAETEIRSCLVKQTCAIPESLLLERTHFPEWKLLCVFYWWSRSWYYTQIYWKSGLMAFIPLAEDQWVFCQILYKSYYGMVFIRKSCLFFSAFC